MVTIRQAIKIEILATMSNVLKLLKNRPTVVNIVHNKSINPDVILKINVHCNPNRNKVHDKCVIVIVVAATT